jgi:hypothetical protein
MRKPYPPNISLGRKGDFWNGYQTMINEALSKYLEKTEKPITEGILRQVIREALKRAVPHFFSNEFNCQRLD